MDDKPKTYKHSLSVTGQIYFCSAPIRLDAYDNCQFGCVYCFSRKRSRTWASPGLHQANPAAFRQRLERVSRGEIASAVDEFLQRRVPIQLGGLQDPFTLREARQRVSIELLRVLRDHNYPTLISTKGSILLEEEYVSILQDMNVVVRFSAAGVRESARPVIERHCDGFEGTLRKIDVLTGRGVICALRLQPIFPGCEKEALDMAESAAAVGARQISFEYLKLPNESIRAEMTAASAVLGYDIVAHMRGLGVSKLGPDWSLIADVKRPFVREARGLCRRIGVNFGAGDTEFIPWSDGNGCCGSSDLVQTEGNQFVANFVGAIKASLKTPHKRVEFSQLFDTWSPTESIGNYMDYRKRISVAEAGGLSDWLALVAKRWNGGKSPYSPAFFDGVVSTGDQDEAGFRIYDASQLAKELA